MILHHVALTPKDLDKTLKFYEEGIGLKRILDMSLEGKWQHIFNARSDKLRSIFLGDPRQPEAGIVELVDFTGGHDEQPLLQAPANGFFLISFVADIHETIARLEALGLARDVKVDKPIEGVDSEIGLLRDPDGVWVELIPFAIQQAPE